MVKREGEEKKVEKVVKFYAKKNDSGISEGKKFFHEVLRAKDMAARSTARMVKRMLELDGKVKRLSGEKKEEVIEEIKELEVNLKSLGVMNENGEFLSVEELKEIGEEVAEVIGKSTA